MSLVADVLSWVLLVVGSVFAVLGAVGLLRFPDFYTRMHSVGVSDTMGAALIIAGCALQAGLTLYTVKLITVWLFIYLTGPAATHALAKAAYSSGLAVNAKREDRSQVPAAPPSEES